MVNNGCSNSRSLGIPFSDPVEYFLFGLKCSIESFRMVSLFSGVSVASLYSVDEIMNGL